MRTCTRTLLTLLALVLVLAACAQDDDPGTAAGDPDPTPAGDGTETDDSDDTGSDTGDGDADETEGDDADADDDEIAEFYSGNTITIRLGLGEGGPNDTVARLVARHLGNHVPGNPNVIVENHPGAGSVLNFNYMYNQADNDGSVIGIPQRQLPLSDLLGQEGIEFHSPDFAWLGGLSEAIYVLVVRTDAATEFEETLENEIVMAASGPGASTYDGPTLLNAVLDTQFNVVPGYDGVADTVLATERGEADGTMLTADGLFASYSNLLDEGIASVLLQVSQEPADERLADVPWVYDYLETDEQRQLMDLYTIPASLGYPYALPPGTPPERVEALRRAFEDMFNDQAFQDDAVNVGLDDLDVMTTGEEMQEIIDRLFATPEETVELFRSYIDLED